jgi:hypothetical protein
MQQDIEPCQHACQGCTERGAEGERLRSIEAHLCAFFQDCLAGNQEDQAAVLQVRLASHHDPGAAGLDNSLAAGDEKLPAPAVNGNVSPGDQDLPASGIHRKIAPGDQAESTSIGDMNILSGADQHRAAVMHFGMIDLEMGDKAVLNRSWLRLWDGNIGHESDPPGRIIHSFGD